MALIQDWLNNCKPEQSTEWDCLGPVENTLKGLLEYFNCPICCSCIEAPKQTPCGHLFCGGCLEGLLKSQNPAFCPICKLRISNRGLNFRQDIHDMRDRIKDLSVIFHKEAESFLKLEESGGTSTLLKPKNVKISNEKKDYGRQHSRFLQNQANTKELEVKKKNSNEAETLNCPNPPSNSSSVQVDAQDQATKNNVKTRRGSQGYIILTESVIPLRREPPMQANMSDEILDLSLTNNRSEDEYYYVPQTAMKFIKPLDLSVKKEKRKLDDPEPGVGETKSGTPVRPTEIPSRSHKRGKFDLYKSTPLKGFQRSSQCQFQGENLSNSSRKCEIFQEKVDANETSKEMTNSDEILIAISDAAFCKSKPPVQLKSQFDEHHPNVQSQSSFVFKPPQIRTPSSSKSQAPKNQTQREIAKPSSKQNSANEGTTHVFCDDDDFMRPRDSDFLILEVPEGDFGLESSNKKQELSSVVESGTTSSGRIGPPVSSSKKVIGKGSQPLETGKSEDSSKSSSKNKDSNINISEGPGRKENPTLITISNVDDSNDPFNEESDDWMNGFVTPETSRNPDNAKMNQCDLSLDVVSKDDNEICSDRELVNVSPKQIVICPSRFKKTQMKSLRQLSQLCGCTIVQDVTEEDFTHLVIILDNGRVPQTFKYLLAIAKHKWVVTFEWIEKCLENGKIISEDPYETANFEMCDIGVRRSRNSRMKLFNGYKFFFATQEFKNNGLTTEEVEMLVNHLGAQVVTSTDEVEGNLIIIGCQNGKEIEYNYWLNSRKWITVTFQWVVDCILFYKLQPLVPKYLCCGLDLSVEQIHKLNIPKSLRHAMNTKSG